MRKRSFISVLILVILIVMLLLIFSPFKGKIHIEKHISNKSKILIDDRAKEVSDNIVALLIDTYNKRNRLENFNIEFTDDLNNEFINVEVKYDSTYILSALEQPIIVGMKKALSELQNEEDIKEEDMKTIINEIDGWIIEFDSIFNAKTKDVIHDLLLEIEKTDENVFKYTLYKKGYHDESGEYIDELAPVKIYYQKEKLTKEVETKLEEDGYNRVKEMAVNLHKQE